MKRDWNQCPPWAAGETLVNSPGVIWQTELELFDELRDRAEENFTAGHSDTKLAAILERLEQSLNARFRDGFLVQIGQLDFSRDRNGNPQVWRGSWAVGLN
jgi:hypothetical protein